MGKRVKLFLLRPVLCIGVNSVGSLVRFFVTPKMKTFLIAKNHKCWRNCGDDWANHIFWGCPRLQLFWVAIWRIMQQVLGHQARMTCISLYLGNLPESISWNDRYLQKILPVAAKKAITCKWLQTYPPTVDNSLETVKEIQEMERLTFLLRLKDVVRL